MTYGIDEAESVFTVEDLGMVTIPEVPNGSTQRWEGRILAKSTVTGDRLYVDCLMLVPVSDSAGETIASTTIAPPNAYAGYDTFEQTAGALAGKTAPIGGAWSGAGDADDFTVVAGSSHWAQRTAVSDAANIPRYELLGAAKYTDILVGLDVSNSNPDLELGNPGEMGALLRYVNAENWLVAKLVCIANVPVQGNVYYLELLKRVGGVFTTLSSWPASGKPIVFAPRGTQTPWCRLEIMVLSNGEWQLAAGQVGQGSPTVFASGIDTDLSSTGALKEGQIGMYDYKQTPNPATRYYDNFQAYIPIFDKAIYANRQLEIRSNQARRQDKDGVTWGRSSYEGDYLLVPQAGPEKRPTRFIVKASRNPRADVGIDDIRAQLYVTPRYLLAPPT